MSRTAIADMGAGPSERAVKCLKEWSEYYSKALDSEFTVECAECGRNMLGNKPYIVITCLICYAKDKGIPKAEIGRAARAAQKKG